jgi:hypothetical protein
MTRHPIARSGSIVAALAALALPLGGCGSSNSSSSKPASSTASPAPTTSSTAAPAAPGLASAERPSAAGFPSARGASLQKLATLAGSSAQLGLATGTFTPGTRRIAFGLNVASGAFVYGPTVLYVAPSASAPAQGPFLAPADPLTVDAPYRSRQNSGPGGIQAIYAAQVPLGAARTYAILALTRTGGRLVGAPGELAVAASSPIPDVGQAPPAIATDTPATVAGNTALLTTRIPPDDMHAVSFRDVLGKRPVALLFSTPQLCMSRVCGPVTDIAAELEHRFGSRVQFIHEEVYVQNQPSKGLRPQMLAFHLQTEPWLFAVDRRGRIAARLEGAFGVNAFTQALEAALR